MSQPLRIAVTADLHWGHHARGIAANRMLFDFLKERPPELLILGGDVGSGAQFADCLTQLESLPCRKALVPGNHDIWVDSGAEQDSLHRYETELPALSSQHGFHYLDHGPLVLREADLAIVGSINWYDYSWSLETLRERFPDDLHRLESKRFPRGRHNDANYVRWPLNDVSFTARVVAAFEEQLRQALEQASRVVVVAHHPPLYGLTFPREGAPVTLESLMWDAFCGNRVMEDVLARHADRIAFVFCGHTHRARETEWNGIRCHNVGGDYHFKRLLCLDWPGGEMQAHEFGQSK
jgi:3',5'-cyclic AMP phosphodiesterase CpdA